MRFTLSLKNLSLALAMVSFLSAGAASAQSLVGVNTRLVQPLDSQTAALGQTVSVKLDDTVKTADGLKLPRGSKLVGKVTEVKAATKGEPASVSVVFNTAELKGGKQIPVKATLLAAYPSSQAEDSQYSDQTMAAVATRVAPDHTVDQEPGALPGVALTASVQNTNSGTFTKANGNFKLSAGTFFQMGVAPATSSSSASAAE
ncbi:MAG TPA: hypothetical protein VMD92_14160 [Acidobacteriaceae bacterium]|nr:hypothetical protein [Acidobacteriaceae bacterium]